MGSMEVEWDLRLELSMQGKQSKCQEALSEAYTFFSWDNCITIIVLSYNYTFVLVLSCTRTFVLILQVKPSDSKKNRSKYVKLKK